MRSDGCFNSADRTAGRRQERKDFNEGSCLKRRFDARNSATAGVDMRVALTYCLLKISAKIGNPSSSLPSIRTKPSSPWTSPLAASSCGARQVVRDAWELSFGDAAHS